ncbi:phosphatidylcholine synthase [Alsobacter sp. SYSU M60028]|uniref:Phosphatidylcholine synthase n=1 Tax=Alsobacter ponti TaxID=2962936 RepID=A0ABT1LDG2_9HYPH|nr:CDP-alcohol phosphatidyltransferase family protein [Alsobacter ponti]MCP8939499.1 phosphatidylcholine synthase [Alsobacter ponti]
MTTDSDEDLRAKRPFAERLPAYCVHFFTASGGALALLALLAAVEKNLAHSFAWLGVALIVDGIDGTIARALHVRDRLPNISGDVLDLVIDFTTYVFVPAAILVYSGIWERGFALTWAVAIVVSAALYFSDLRMKTPDNWFAGFPAVWNVVVFYLIIYQPSPWIATAVIAAAAVGQALPLVFVHPFRVKQFKPVTLVMCVVWMAAGFMTIAEDLKPDGLTNVALLASALYFTGLGLLRKRPASPHA